MTTRSVPVRNAGCLLALLAAGYADGHVVHDPLFSPHSSLQAYAMQSKEDAQTWLTARSSSAMQAQGLRHIASDHEQIVTRKIPLAFHSCSTAPEAEPRFLFTGEFTIPTGTRSFQFAVAGDAERGAEGWYQELIDPNGNDRVQALYDSLQSVSSGTAALISNPLNLKLRGQAFQSGPLLHIESGLITDVGKTPADFSIPGTWRFILGFQERTRELADACGDAVPLLKPREGLLITKSANLGTDRLVFNPLVLGRELETTDAAIEDLQRLLDATRGVLDLIGLESEFLPLTFSETTNPYVVLNQNNRAEVEEIRAELNRVLQVHGRLEAVNFFVAGPIGTLTGNVAGLSTVGGPWGVWSDTVGEFIRIAYLPADEILTREPGVIILHEAIHFLGLPHTISFLTQSLPQREAISRERCDAFGGVFREVPLPSVPGTFIAICGVDSDRLAGTGVDGVDVVGNIMDPDGGATCASILSEQITSTAVHYDALCADSPFAVDRFYYELNQVQIDHVRNHILYHSLPVADIDDGDSSGVTVVLSAGVTNTYSISEGAASGTPVPGLSLTVSVNGAPTTRGVTLRLTDETGPFALSTPPARIVLQRTLDYETVAERMHVLTVEAEAMGVTDRLMLTIHVNNVNDEPAQLRFHSGTATVIETAAAGTVVSGLRVEVVRDPDGAGFLNAHRFAVEGTDLFEVNAAGEVLVAASLAGSAGRTVRFTLVVHDGDDIIRSDADAYTVIIRGVTVVLSAGVTNTYSISEDAASGTPVPGLSLTVSVNGAPTTRGVTLRLTDETGPFAISTPPARIVLQRTLNYETVAERMHVLTVEAEAMGVTDRLMLTIHVNNVNDEPAQLRFHSGTATVTETAATGTVVSGLRVEVVRDPDGAGFLNAHRFAVEGTDLFEVNAAGEVLVAASLAGSAGRTVRFTLVVHDGDDIIRSDADAYTVIIRGVTVVLSAGVTNTYSISEDAASGTPVPGLSLTVSVNGAPTTRGVTLRLTDETGPFAISTPPARIVLQRTLNYETVAERMHVLTVEAEAMGVTDRLMLTIHVNNVNDEPAQLRFHSGTATVIETAATGTVVSGLRVEVVRDPDGAGFLNAHRFAVEGTDLFEVNAAGEVLVAASLAGSAGRTVRFTLVVHDGDDIIRSDADAYTVIIRAPPVRIRVRVFLEGAMSP